MRRYLVIVEGKADVNFLRDYLKHLFKAGPFKIEEIGNEIIIEFPEIHIKFLVLRGYTVIATTKLRTRIQSEIDQAYKLVLIQDADDPSKENGGVNNRLDYLHKIKQELKFEFDTFLFPNNKDDGDLETLLLMIAKKEQYASYFGNYKTYADNIKSFSDEAHGTELLQRKFIVFNYFQAYFGMERAKEENREFDEKYWDLTKECMKPLQQFLEQILGVKEH
jgi:hypothetical protein